MNLSVFGFHILGLILPFAGSRLPSFAHRLFFPNVLGLAILTKFYTDMRICPTKFGIVTLISYYIYVPTEGEGDILFLVRILLASALALASASASA